MTPNILNLSYNLLVVLCLNLLSAVLLVFVGDKVERVFV